MKPTTPNRPDAGDSYNEFTPANCVLEPSDTFNGQFTVSLQKTGAVTFSKALYIALEAISPGKKPVRVTFLQDKERPKEWFIRRVEAIGFQINEAGTKYKTYKMQNAKLCKLIRESLSFPDKTSVTSFVARKPTEDESSPYFGMYPILTGSAKAVQRKTKEKS